MLSYILFMIIIALPIYLMIKRVRERKLNAMLARHLGDDILNRSVANLSHKKVSKQKSELYFVYQLYNSSVIFILGIQRFIVLITISLAYLFFVWFCCFTFGLSFLVYILSSIVTLCTAFLVMYSSYKEAFSNYFESQFPYALRLISRNLAVGQTIYSAIDAAALNLNGIMQKEFKRISSQLKSGANFEEILDKGELIYPYKGYYVFSSYLKVSLQKGTSLKDILLDLADDLVSSQVIKKKTKALTSESRGAAVILACLPFLMLIVMYLLSRDNLIYLFEAQSGRYVLIYVVTSVSIGFFLISQMIKKVEL